MSIVLSVFMLSVVMQSVGTIKSVMLNVVARCFSLTDSYLINLPLKMQPLNEHQEPLDGICSFPESAFFLDKRKK